MAYYQKYKIEFDNYEEQRVKLLIHDTFSLETNPYGLSHTVVPNGGADQTITVSFNSIPAGCTGTRIYALDGNGNVMGDSGVLGNSGPVSWITCPLNVVTFAFYFIVPVPGDDELFILGELDGVTDELPAGGDPLHLVVNNNAGDKLTSIQGTQLVIEINAADNATLNKLLRGNYSDRRYKVFAYINDRLFFTGYLLAGEAEEPFMPNPTIQLTAVDGLGSLKNKPLLKPDGTVPTGYNRIIDYIAWCLQQTGHQLSISAVMNIRSEFAGTISSDADGHLYVTEYLDAKTFEKEIGELEDCYTVLQKILKHTCFLGMRHGVWWIKNVDEFDTQPDYVAEFTYGGEFIEMRTGAYYSKEIGIDENMKWSGESCRVNCSSPAKYAKDIFRHEKWKEVPCNIDFSRGTIFSDTPTLKKYSIECWTKLYKDGTGDHASAANMYIETQLINGEEVNRYLHFEDNGVFNFIMSEAIPMNAGDRAEINVDRRMESNHATAGTDECVQLRLYGDDGTFWTHHGKNNSASPDADVAYWVQCDALFQTFQKFHNFHVADDYDDTESTSLYSGEVGPLPVSGEVKILVYMSSLWGMTEDTYIEQVSFDYLPYINGTFNKYSGQHHKVTGSNDNESVEEDVHISDAPNKLTKGALIRYNGSKYVLSGRYWNAAVYPTGVPDDSYYHRFGYIQIFNVWNQVRLLNRIMRGSIQGIESSSVDALDRTDLPTIFHSYYMRDVDEHTNSKKFMLLNCDIDLYRCEFTSSTFKEVHDEVIGKKYTDTHEFKYITG